MNPFQQDFLYLTEAVRETHPEPYVAWSKDQFDSEQAHLLNSLSTDTSKAAFEESLKSFLSHLHDGHTGAPAPWLRGQRQYPVSFFWIKDTLILASVGSEADTTLLGSHVLGFDGIPTDEVLTRFSRFISYENVYQARRTLQYYFVFPSLQREAGVTHSDTLDLSLLGRDGSVRTYRVLPVEQPKRVFHYETNPITQKVNRLFKYTILEKEKACYFQWNAMADLRIAHILSFPSNLFFYPVAWFNGIGYFDNFLKNMFEDMEEQGVKTLIVDLRGNGGGGSIYGEMLLYHLKVPPNIRNYSMAIRFSPLYGESFPEEYHYYASRYAEKFSGRQLPDSLIVTSSFVHRDSVQAQYFRNVTDKESDYYIEPDRTIFIEHVYFLVGDGTYSSAIILSTIVKDNKLFTIVGQPTRGRPSHYGQILSLKLPNSSIVCTISCKKFFRPDVTKDSEDSLYPDVAIWPTYDDLVHGRDPVFDWVLQDARKRAATAN
ncbi:MAG: S41 family peptidase [Bacteroidetes bacterium]|nr:S41 family peptidase [Bacteroidota bacterium]